LLKFVTGPYCFFVFLKSSSRLLGCLQSRRVFLRFRFVTHDRREKTANGMAARRERRVNSRGKAVTRGSVGEGDFSQKGPSELWNTTQAILQRQPPLDVSWRRRQPPNADTMVDSCCRLSCASLFYAAPRRVERVEPAAFLLRRGDEKNPRRR